MPTNDTNQSQQLTAPPAPPTGDQPLLSLHAFAVFLGAAAGGAAAGALMFAKTHSMTGAAIAGGAAFFAAVPVLHKLVG